MHKLFHLVVKDRLCGNLWSKDLIKAECFLGSGVDQCLIADSLPNIVIFIVFGLFRSQRLYPDRHVNFAFYHHDAVLFLTQILFEFSNEYRFS